MPSFSVLTLWYTYGDSHPSRGSKEDTLAAKKLSYFAKKRTFEA